MFILSSFPEFLACISRETLIAFVHMLTRFALAKKHHKVIPVLIVVTRGDITIVLIKHCRYQDQNDLDCFNWAFKFLRFIIHSLNLLIEMNVYGVLTRLLLSVEMLNQTPNVNWSGR